MEKQLDEKFAFSLFANARMNGFLLGMAYKLSQPNSADFNLEASKKILKFLVDINECREIRFVDAQEKFYLDAKKMLEQINQKTTPTFPNINKIRNN